LLLRRRVIAGIGVAAAAAVARPRSIKAAGELTVWWSQGFYEAENKAVIDSFAAWGEADRHSSGAWGQ
jgi:hypothetical protein